MTSSAIEILWNEHRSLPFPDGFAGDEVAGICLASLDTFAAGCIQTFLASGGKLDRDKVAVLDSCHKDLVVVVPQIEGDAKRYFVRLEQLARMVLESVRGTA